MDRDRVPTLVLVSTPDSDASSRLSSALAEIFGQAPQLPSVPGESAESGESTDTETPFELPHIVPATVDVPLPQQVAPEPIPTPVISPVISPVPSPAPVATGWGDHMAPLQVHTGSGAQLRGPGRRPRVRKVTRVVRHIDPWSTFKVGLIFSAVAYVVVLTSGVLLWRVADSTGTLDNVERWFTQFGWETFELKGGEVFANAWVIGLFGVVAMTGAMVLMATLFNLVSDIIGGIRVTVLEEEVVERTVSSTRRYVVRRPPAAVVGPSSSVVPDWNVDDDTVAVPVQTNNPNWSVADDEG